MGRTPRGADQVQQALELVKSGDIENLRTGLAILLPTKHGLTLEETAVLLGKSTSWVSKRRKLALSRSTATATKPSTHGGRRNQVMNPSEEEQFIHTASLQYVDIHKRWRSPYTSREELRAIGPRFSLTYVQFIHKALTERAGYPVSKATVYNLLSRVGKKCFPNYQPWMWKDKYRKLI